MDNLLVIVYDDEPYEWRPEDFGFKLVVKSPDALECIWEKGHYELRFRPNKYGPFWLCRKVITEIDRKSSIESKKIFINFSKKIYPTDKEFASMLLDKRL